MDNKAIWVVGDIHGSINHLLMLLDAIKNAGGKRIIFVGDYIDKGSDSKKVIDTIINLNGIEKICLLGNHEQLMLDYLFCDIKNDDHMRYLWITNGGSYTINSFGFNNAYDFKRNLKAKYLNFFTSLKNFYECKIKLQQKEFDILVTHAGLNPLIDKKTQISIGDYFSLKTFIIDNNINIEQSNLWVRELYFNTYIEEWSNFILIHGHTPTSILKKYLRNYKYSLRKDLFPKDQKTTGHTPFFRFDPYKSNHLMSIDIDTEAFNNKRLTAIGFNEVEDYDSLKYRIIQSELFPQKQLFDYEIICD